MTNVSTKFNPQTSGVLPNGARIRWREQTGEFWVWLAYWDGHAFPYVTWLSRIDSPGSTFWGNYWASYEAAEQDYLQRVKKYA